MNNPKIIIVMPAYNAEKTLDKTYRDIPKGIVSEVILCDDCSRDRTVEIAKSLNLTLIAHDKNKGYGANQKTCYKEALSRAVDIVVMLHPDYQYDSKKIPELVRPILEGKADVVLGSRILNGGALRGGMPLCKYISNRFSTIYENRVLGLNLSEYHTGLRAYSRKFLETVDWKDYSDDFLFDGQILIDAARYGFKITEIAIETRYFKEASQISISRGIKYGIGIFFELEKYKKRVLKKRVPTGLSAFLVFLLMVFSLFRSWNYGQLTPGIDFYKFWAVGRAVRAEQFNIYTDAARDRIGLDFLERSRKDADQSRFRWAAENCRHIATYSSPFLYSVFSIGSSIDYERDFKVYLLVRLFCTVFAVMVLCRLLRYSAVASMASVIIFTTWFEPFLSDLRIANVNQIQLGLLALFLWIQSRHRWRYRDFLGGFILGTSLMFKPNIILVPVMLSISWLVNRRFRKIGLELAGAMASVVCALIVSTVLFDSIGCWPDWVKAMLSLRDAHIEVADGNFSLSMLIYEWLGARASTYLTVIFLVISSVFIWLNRSRTKESCGHEGEFFEDALMVGMGCVVYMISAKLVWLHYLILTIPMILFVLRPAATGIVTRRLFGAAAIAAIGLIPIQILFKVTAPRDLAILTSLGTLTLFVLGLQELRSLNYAARK